MNNQIKVDGNNIVLKTKYDPNLISSIKQTLDGRQWNPTEKVWVCPLNRQNIDAVDAIVKEYPEARFHSCDLHAALAAATAAREKALDASQSCDAKIEIDGLNGQLRPFQRAGVAYVVDKKRAILADEQGLGKTIQAIAAIHHQQAYPAVIIVPAIVKLNWRNEIRRWLPDTQVAVLGVGKRQAGCDVDQADFVVVNYEIVPRHLDRLLSIHPKAVACDEAQYLKNAKSKRSQAVAQLISNAKPEIVLMLTGTPILNRPIELTSPLRMLGVLDSEFGGWLSFAKRYCEAYRDKFGWNVNGAEHLEELQDRLRESCMVRREKKQVLTELPDKIHVDLEVTLARDCGYKEERKRFLAWLDATLLARGVVVDKKASLPEKVLAITRRSGKDAANILAQMTAMRQATGIGKIPAIIEWIKGFEETEQPLVVFAYHKDVQDALRQAFPLAAMITGEMSAESRQKAVDDFQLGQKKLIICSLKAAQVGITLTAASNILMTELDWTPASLEQAEDRCHRIGQRNSVTVYRSIAADGFDQDMLEILDRKSKIITKAIKGGVVDKNQEIKGGRPRLPEGEARKHRLTSKRTWANVHQQQRTEYMREYRRKRRIAAGLPTS